MNYKSFVSFSLLLLFSSSLQAVTLQIQPSEFLYVNHTRDIPTMENNHLFDYLPHEDGGYYIAGPEEIGEHSMSLNTTLDVFQGDTILGIRCTFWDDDNEEIWNEVHAGVGYSPFSPYHPVTNGGMLFYLGIDGAFTDNTGTQNLFEFESDPSETWQYSECDGTDECYAPEPFEPELVFGVSARFTKSSQQLRFMGCEVDVERGQERQCDNAVCGAFETCVEETGGECECNAPVNEVYISGSDFFSLDEISLLTYHSTLSETGGYFEGCLPNVNHPTKIIYGKVPLVEGDEVTEVLCDFIDMNNIISDAQLDDNYWWEISSFYLLRQNIVDADDPSIGTLSYEEHWSFMTADGLLQSITPGFFKNHQHGGPLVPGHTIESGTYWIRAGLRPGSLSGSCGDELIFGGCVVKYVPADPCENVVCGNDASCNAQTGQCECAAGYFGNGCDCVDVNECETGDNDCGANTVCVNTEGAYGCECASGYEMNNSGACVDRNECDPSAVSPCHPLYGNCQNTEGSYLCSCDDGFSGDGVSCLDVNECANANDNDCDANATCMNVAGGYECQCNVWFSGDGVSCEPVADLCDSNPCQNGGTCLYEEGQDNYSCDCTDDYAGINCQWDRSAQALYIPEGWSMISTFIDTTGRDFMNDITPPIHEDVLLAKDYLGNAMMLEWNYSAIGDWKVGAGYQIKMANPRTLVIFGGHLPGDHPIEITEGWSMIAYMRMTRADALAALQPLIDEDNLVIAKNYMGQAVMPEWNYNGIGDLIPGQGYQIKTEFATTFQYLPNGQSY